MEQGDTIVTIALKFGSTVEDIQTANELAANDLIGPATSWPSPYAACPLKSCPPRRHPRPRQPAGAPVATAVIRVELRLISPSEAATVPRTEPVLLQWASVDVLKPNEWYVLQIMPRSPAARPFSTAWTKQTSYQLGAELAPAEGELAEYDWRLSVVRVIPAADGRLALEAASPASETRRFVWK